MTASREELEGLLRRVEGARGPDRDLDVEIGTYFGFADHSSPAYHRPFRDWARHYTASVDAVLDLATTTLPRRQMEIMGPLPNWGARFHGDLEGHFSESLALAILGATLRAIIAQTEPVSLPNPDPPNTVGSATKAL